MVVFLLITVAQVGIEINFEKGRPQAVGLFVYQQIYINQ
jgi:hypothetical protein